MGAASKAQTGKGATLGYAAYSDSDTSPPTAFTTIANVVKADVDITRGEVENVDLSTDFDAYLSTNCEAETTITVRHAQGNAGIAKILALVASGVETWFQIVEKDKSTIVWHGFLKGYKISFENKTIVDAEVPLRLNIFPIFTPAS